ncbi:hypothetical protein GCM10023187_09520 [Nibrella viscosa]|uniref:DUF2157 domain-containing protein n=1 Tax=Nibrella viscosa TaxID=1084524 RepID=A0ABP8K0C2_9BACT
MSPKTILDELAQQGLLSKEQQTTIADIEDRRPFSVHFELRSILYVGILLFAMGLGLLIYDNIDRISHTAVVVTMSVLCLLCFAFAWLYRPPMSNRHVKSRSPFSDYALILGCLLFLTLEGYLQYQYNLFGERYGLVTIIPAVLFLILAYRFDHRGVLSMALVALISWIGVTIQPLNLYFKGNFFDLKITFSAIILSLVLIGAGMFLERQLIKRHFTFTYLTIAGNLLLLALVAGVFNFDDLRIMFALGLAAACFLFDRYARYNYARRGRSRRERAFLYALMSSVYGYIGFTYLLFHYLEPNNYVGTLYFLLTGIGLVMYLLHYRRTLVTT